MSDFTASNIPPYPSALSFLYKVYDGGITSESYIPGFNHVSVPMIISGFEDSISKAVSWFLDLALWKFTVRTLREFMFLFILYLPPFLGDDEAIGLPMLLRDEFPFSEKLVLLSKLFLLLILSM